MDEEYEELLRQEKIKQAEQTVCQEENTNMDMQIERLAVLKKQLEEWKDEYRDITDAFVRYPEQYLVEEWHGDVYDKTTEQIWNDIQEKSLDIVGKIDIYLDAVCNKIVELKNAQEENIFLISSIKKELRILRNEIEKYLD